ncbi:MAG: 30S ribosomal protein S1 [Saprospiraceae bacterium]|mgnify:FL=1|jgi:small subunit ribosomal protein S1|uniref:30S ribosomal protein S1 n=1 Tax=Candidatus Brachybacter algidus TaxID=2982024 RepID=UPI001B723F88|nr:30S ribosomal protein S1 [Candidatus Brachybacter algidus]MBK6372626.1 30S ribosomal protein S1 [Candidatus Brachybacter algidus]MBK6448402.1 30S ribosomal protein S1 [Candidatus Brachybacter algidus]MBP7540569.1 30S ribosomal protein S1 [Saprospiraceae bacterium]MBP8893321.1 30S ribosomal protein S1 [Saprospiraceae bacterium]
MSENENLIDENQAQEVAQAAETTLPQTPKAPKTAHDDFDWSINKRNHVEYEADVTKKYLEEYENTLTSIKDNEIVKGIVKVISGGDVVLDINYKSDGIISLSEFRDIQDLKVGDYVDVYVESQEDARGQLVLSRKKAKLLIAWDTIVDSFNNGTIIKGTVISKTKGGLIVDAYGLETFLPGSQIDIKPIIDYDAYVGKTMEFKVVKINETIKNAVVSHKALIESDIAEQREHIIAGLEKGQVLEGVVKNITDFGAFMDLGGVDGLLYITDISWGRINHPDEVLQMNDKINVVVLDFDENKKRISLGLKQLTPHPWEVLAMDISEGSTVKGKIVNVEDYGAFLEVSPGVEGLIHVSEVSWSNQPVAARDFFKLDQEYEAKVVTIDRDDRKMSLSLKQLQEDPWSDIEANYPVNSRHTGVVKNLTPYGVFVEINNGIGGMVHISDLSWTKRFSHPSEFTKVGDNIEIVILEIDKENRKLSLGHKQIEENPWDAFESVFPIGSYHEATIIRKDDKGATVQLPYGLEAFAPIKHLKKEDGSTAEQEETLTVKVIEFNRDDKRILVSHQRYLEDIKKEADNLIRREKDSADTESRAAVKSQQGKIERTTLGDIDAFSQLKQQFDEAGEKALVEAKAKIATKEADAAVEAPVAEAKVDVPATEVVEEAPVVEDVVEIADVKASDETTTEDVAEETANDIAESSDEKAPSDDVAEA